MLEGKCVGDVFESDFEGVFGDVLEVHEVPKPAASKTRGYVG